MRGLPGGRDHGGVTVFFTIFASAWLALIGLIIVGGARTRHLQLADNIASEAARAAGQAIDLGSAVSGDGPTIDPLRVQEAIDNYLVAVRLNQPDKTINGTGVVLPNGDVAVLIQLTYDSPVDFPWPGSNDATVIGTATATLLVQ
jgi:hypothetical protein